jgi:hypothetical protein
MHWTLWAIAAWLLLSALLGLGWIGAVAAQRAFDGMRAAWLPRRTRYADESLVPLRRRVSDSDVVQKSF